jgi:sensor c-di-GMP phosphodiesterase-like protein
MAKKSKTRRRTSRAQQQRQQTKRGQQRQRQRLILGGAILVLVVGAVMFLRYRQQSQIPPRLQGAIDNHYTRGVAGAPVVIKEFSDYG